MISQSDAFALAASLELPKFKANLDPAIDWDAVHESHGTFAMCFFDLYFHTKAKVDDVVPTVKLLGELGCSPSTIAPRKMQKKLNLCYKEEKDDETGRIIKAQSTIEIDMSNKSAIQVATRLKYELERLYKDERWAWTLKKTVAVLDAFAQMSLNPRKDQPQAHQIPEHTVEVWERCRGNVDLADVSIVVPGGEEVKCHALVLCSASPVLASMLGCQGTFKYTEGRTKE